VSGGHLGHSAADCTECWAVAYEPGWYAVLSAGEGVIHLPKHDRGDVMVRIPESPVTGDPAPGANPA
jgi:hypothetical protein